MHARLLPRLIASVRVTRTPLPHAAPSLLPRTAPPLLSRAAAWLSTVAEAAPADQAAPQIVITERCAEVCCNRLQRSQNIC